MNSKSQAELDAYAQVRRDELEFKSKLLKRNRAYDWTSRTEINHHKIVYQMVTDVLGLDHEMCKQVQRLETDDLTRSAMHRHRQPGCL